MEPRLIHIEYETSTEKNWKPQDATISVLSIREKDLKQIIFSSSCGAQVVFTRENVVKALTQYQQRTTSDIRHEKVQEALKDLKNSMNNEETPNEKILTAEGLESAFNEFIKKSAKKYSEDADIWKHRLIGMRCRTCMWYVPKRNGESATRELACTGRLVGRCRRHAPTMNGYPVCFEDDWCGDHKLDETKI
jgi:hypothetical protein